MNTSTTDTHSKDNLSDITPAKKAEFIDLKLHKKYKNDSNSNRKFTIEEERDPVRINLL